MTNTNNRPGNMETVYENRKTLACGKIISYEDKFKTMIIELSDGKTISITYSTFRSAWRKKVVDEALLAVADPDNACEDEYVKEVMQQKEDLGIECPPITEEPELVPMSGTESGNKLLKKRGALLTYNGKSQNICAWARELKINANTLYNRIYNKGMTFEEAIKTPVKRSKRNGV